MAFRLVFLVEISNMTVISSFEGYAVLKYGDCILVAFLSVLIMFQVVTPSEHLILMLTHRILSYLI